MAETPSAAPPPFPIHAPIFISRVYPVLEVDHTLVEWVDPIEDAYSFWGKTLLSAVLPEETTFFPAPLSYPYRFSQQGIQNLQQKLKQIQEIDSATITERDFPNILPNRQELYSAEEKKKFLRGEKYISFRINGWPSVEVMKFPTFVVLAFDHTSTSVKALEDYRQLVAKDWNDKIEAFHKFDNLRRILGITHKEAVWRRVPSLTFIAFLKPDVYYYNHYLWRWETQPEHVKIPFLKDIRLQGLKGSTYPDYLVLKQCKNIVYEYASDRPFGRFYYASHPLFYQGKNFPGRDSSFLHGSEGLVERILRTALFVNVTLPSMVDLSQKLKDSLGRNVYEIQKMRMELFDTFSNSEIKSSHANLRSKIENNWDIIRQIGRIDEAQTSFSHLVEYIKQPFTPTIPHSYPPGQITPTIPHLYPPGQTQDTSSKNEDPCLDLFHFHKTYNVVNDGDKAREYIRDIVNNRQSIEINQRRFEDEISNTSTLLESRRTLLKDRENTLVAIILPALCAFIGGTVLYYVWTHFWPWR